MLTHQAFFVKMGRLLLINNDINITGKTIAMGAHPGKGANWAQEQTQGMVSAICESFGAHSCHIAFKKGLSLSSCDL